MDKTFLSYQEQVEKLINEKNLIINNKDYAISMLKQISYFGLISGYKDPFRNPNTNKYKNNTTFEELVALYKFDENLRELFLKYLLRIELHIRSLLSYYFTEKFGENQEAYLCSENYNYTQDNQKELTRLINKLYGATESDTFPYIKHYRDTQNNIPLWILINNISFGTLGKMYQLLKLSLQTKITKNFSNINENQIGEILIVLNKFRNVCAHNERLYSFKATEDIPNMPVHKALNIPKNHAQYIYGKRDLFAVLIGFKYLLNEKDFYTFKESLNRIINHFIKIANHLPYEDLLSSMGFPINWNDI